MNRSALAQALAKATAYVGCGKPEEAAVWLGRLVAMFEAEGVVVK